MAKLEMEPSSYEMNFTDLTNGINQMVKSWILDHITGNQKVLEVGCGPGVLAHQMAAKASSVTAVDFNIGMIDHAKETYQLPNLLFQSSLATDLKYEKGEFDSVVSTFMVSELRPLEQQTFLRSAWRVLKPHGKMYLAEEFIPKGFSKFIYSLRRRYYQRKLGRIHSGEEHPLLHFHKYLKAIGFSLKQEQIWGHGSIRVLELEKTTPGNIIGQDEAGFYLPKAPPFSGIKAWLKIARCVFTGQIDYVPIEPGLYRVGNPTPESPILMTANYIYTYIQVQRDLKGLDAWLLVADSKGINVWCAARGNEFGNKQVVEVVRSTPIKSLCKSTRIILPQLAAGGVAIPKLPKISANFQWTFQYGPVWASDLPLFLKDHPARKPEKMKLAQFSLYHRLRAGLTHTAFLFRKIFLLPLLVLAIGLYIAKLSPKIWFPAEIALTVFISNIVMVLIFPFYNYSRRFILKGFGHGIVTVLIVGNLNWVLHQSWPYLGLNVISYFWIAFFSTMSFSGYTMDTGPKEIAQEYPNFRLIQSVLFVIGIVLSGISLFYY
jgi:ubiquinone/menaquinone biosynthesis C-methylase UbiE